MKCFVITIRELEESQKSADRCIKSASRFGLEVNKYFGVTPAHDPVKLATLDDIPVGNFREKYSRFENCLSAFISHYSLWKLCVEDNEDYLIFEHDAVVNNEIKENVHFKGVLSYGAPSYGKFHTPPTIGVNKLCSKQYLPGAHAYRVKPKAAEILVRQARGRACPTDLYLSNANFSFIEEYYPWPVSADDTFTTIQNETGCIAKHNNSPQYRVL